MPKFKPKTDRQTDAHNGHLKASKWNVTIWKAV